MFIFAKLVNEDNLNRTGIYTKCGFGLNEKWEEDQTNERNSR